MMNTNRQILFHAISARRTILRREGARNFNQRFTGTFCLVFQLDNFRGFADAKLEGFLYDLRSGFHYRLNDCRQGIQVVEATCLPVFNYTKHTSFLQSPILIYVRRTIAEKRDCCGTPYISDQICQRIKLWSESWAKS